MRIGVVSDTHGHVQNARAAVYMLKSLDVETVLHCGDIGSAAIVGLFGGWPTHFVLGNVDHETAELQAAIEQCGQTFHGQFGAIELAGVKIALLHGDNQRLLDRTIAEGAYRLVCHGHTHVPRCEQVGEALVLNPGALYRAARHTIAVVELPAVCGEIIPV